MWCRFYLGLKIQALNRSCSGEIKARAEAKVAQIEEDARPPADVGPAHEGDWGVRGDGYAGRPARSRKLAFRTRFHTLQSVSGYNLQ